MSRRTPTRFEFKCPHCGALYVMAIRTQSPRTYYTAICSYCGDVMTEWQGHAHYRRKRRPQTTLSSQRISSQSPRNQIKRDALIVPRVLDCSVQSIQQRDGGQRCRRQVANSEMRLFICAPSGLSALACKGDKPENDDPSGTGCRLGGTCPIEMLAGDTQRGETRLSKQG